MKTKIFYNLSAGKNAENKYQERNKLKQKLSGLFRAMQEYSKLPKQKKISIPKTQIKKHWFHKFRFFFTTNNFLVLGGRDAKSNELLVKKHFKENDLYFHAEIYGAAHVVLKNPDNKEIPELDRLEAANFALIFSSAWKNHAFSTQVYSVTHSQVSKSAFSGESLGSGAFVIRGKRDYYKKLNLKLRLIFDADKGVYAFPHLLTSGSIKQDFLLSPGSQKKSDVLKSIKNYFSNKQISLSLEQIDAALPAGSFLLEFV